MNLSKGINLYIFILFFLPISCTNKVAQDKRVKIKTATADSLFKIYGSNIAVMSCLRCGCFVDEYNKRFKASHEIPQGYTLLTDTTCNSLMFPVKHLPGRIFDDLSEDIYNLTFMRKVDTGIVIKILQVEESSKIGTIARTFFR